MKYKQHIGLIPNVSYGDFVLGSNINMYLSQEHTKKMYDEVTFSNISYFFKREEINVWCDTDGSINTIICSSYCLFHNKNLIGMKYTDFLTEFSKEPDSEDNIYVLVSGKGQRQHVYDFEKDGLQVWVWRNRIRTVLIYKQLKNGYTLRSNVHSHPENTPYPSRLNGGSGDIPYAQKITDESTQNPSFKIYLPGKGTCVKFSPNSSPEDFGFGIPTYNLKGVSVVGHKKKK